MDYTIVTDETIILAEEPIALFGGPILNLKKQVFKVTEEPIRLTNQLESTKNFIPSGNTGNSGPAQLWF